MEVLIVVSIMALISAGIGFVVINQMTKARIKTTTTKAQALRRVAETHLALESGPCPTVAELVAAGDLEEDNEVDAWSRPFSIACTGVKIIVRSAGPDRQIETEDDIVVPASMRSHVARGEHE